MVLVGCEFAVALVSEEGERQQVCCSPICLAGGEQRSTSSDVFNDILAPASLSSSLYGHGFPDEPVADRMKEANAGVTTAGWGCVDG